MGRVSRVCGVLILRVGTEFLPTKRIYKQKGLDKEHYGRGQWRSIQGLAGVSSLTCSHPRFAHSMGGSTILRHKLQTTNYKLHHGGTTMGRAPLRHGTSTPIRHQRLYPKRPPDS